MMLASVSFKPTPATEMPRPWLVQAFSSPSFCFRLLICAELEQLDCIVEANKL
jgi:hypothetical protein